MMKALFLDRDGTLIIDKHYLHKVEDIEYFPDTFEALQTASHLGYHFFMITNQSGIGRGYFKKEDADAVHKEIKNDFLKHQIILEDVKMCPHQPKDQCDCRKPSPLMIQEIMNHYKIDKNHSYMLGDKNIDVQCGLSAGIKGHLINYHPEKGPLSTLLDFVQSHLCDGFNNE